MRFITFLFVLYVFINTMSYGIFEIKNNQNKKGGIAVIFTAISALILPNIFLWVI